MPEKSFHTYREIVTQGEAWESTLSDVQSRAGELARWLDGKCEDVLFTGCGSTYYLSTIAAAVWREVTKAPAAARPASEVWLYPEVAMTRTPSLLVAVSRSGETSETLKAVDTYRAAGGRHVLCITVYPDKPLAGKADYVLVARESEEVSLAQTRSFGAMLWLAQVTALIAAGRMEHLSLLRDAGALADRLVRSAEPIARQLGRHDGIQRFTFLGSGPYHGLAREAMLKMTEMSQSPSEAFHVLEFRHGPKAVVGPDMLIVGFVSDQARDQEIAVLREMRALGARVLTVVERFDNQWDGDSLTLDSGLPPEMRAPTPLPFLQLLAYHRAAHRGLDPDNPVNLSMSVQL